ncbi:MAG: Uma2 family endonuclease, partial [Myxococcota bacterium]
MAPNESTRITVERYFDLVEAGVLSEDDRVELLEGVIVAMTPSNPPHAAAVTMVTRALFRAVGERASVRTQCALVLTPYSCPEPDVAVVPGSDRDYISTHPATALLVVEVADASLQQDRITKAAIYAAAGIPDYWIVNLRNGVVEVMRAHRPRGTVRASPRSPPPRAAGCSVSSRRSPLRGAPRRRTPRALRPGRGRSNARRSCAWAHS